MRGEGGTSCTAGRGAFQMEGRETWLPQWECPGVLEKGKSDSVAGVRKKSENEAAEVRGRGDATRQPL